MILTDLRILVVDDVKSTRMLLRKSLISLGFMQVMILEAESTDKAIEILISQYTRGAPIQIILSDWEMPEKSGLNLLQFVRKTPMYAHIPFIMITTVNKTENVVQAVTEGANNYLIKPWNQGDLDRKLEEVWRKCKKAIIKESG